MSKPIACIVICVANVKGSQPASIRPRDTFGSVSTQVVQLGNEATNPIERLNVGTVPP